MYRKTQILQTDKKCIVAGFQANYKIPGIGDHALLFQPSHVNGLSTVANRGASLSMNVEFINPFLASITNILATMATLPVVRGKAQVTRSDTPPADVTGVINMRSARTSGTLIISFPQTVILDIAFRMLGEKFESVDADVIDLVGEITNMVCGQAKQLLDEKGFNFDMARPTVFAGARPIELIAALPAIVVPFACDKGEFYVEICFADNAA
jgi:chemotaxis protein CheX